MPGSSSTLRSSDMLLLTRKLSQIFSALAFRLFRVVFWSITPSQ